MKAVIVEKQVTDDMRLLKLLLETRVDSPLLCNIGETIKKDSDNTNDWHILIVALDLNYRPNMLFKFTVDKTHISVLTLAKTIETLSKGYQNDTTYKEASYYVKTYPVSFSYSPWEFQEAMIEKLLE